MPNQPNANAHNQREGLDRKITYHPPEPMLIDRFASNVCRAMAERGGESTVDPEVVSGFSSFIKLVAKVKSKELNGEIGAVIDKPEQER